VPRRVRGAFLTLVIPVLLLAYEERGLPYVYRCSMTVYARAWLGLTVSTSHGLAEPALPDTRRYTGPAQKTCHTPALRDAGARPASGRIRLRPPLGLKPVEQSISQTESVLSLRHIRPDRGPPETPRMPTEARGYVSGQPMVLTGCEC
jgi:hypothetical protein